MSEQQLRTMLESSASAIEVGPVPLGTIERSARGRRRRRLSAVLLASAVVGAGGLGAIDLLHDGRDAPAPGTVIPRGERLDLPTSGWREGDGAMTALIRGILRVDERGCVYIGSLDPQLPSRIPAVWPAGFSATLDRGELTLYDSAGAAVARGGDKLRMGGGYVPRQEQHPCVGSGEVAYVQSDIEVTGHRDPARADIALPTSEWEAGKGGDGALLEGELYVDPDHCVRVGDPLRPSRSTTPIWPKGFTAAVEDDQLTVYDADGQEVAHDGDTISVGGGGADPGGASGGCLSEAFLVQSDVTVVASDD